MIDGMKLRAWLHENGETAKAFSLRIGVDPSAVVRYCNGQQFPSIHTLAAIERETGGAVRTSDFFDTEAAG
jgi:transcriptional regulator with XRE-family HTH domain